MRNGFRFLCINIFCVAVFGFSSMGRAEIMLDKVVAVVNSEVITWSEVYKAMEFDASPAVKAMSEQERSKIFKENEASFLENMINMRLFLQEAKKSNINASDDEINRTMASIREKYNMTDVAFTEALKKEGFTLEEYKKKLAEQIIINRLVDQEVRSRIVVTDEDVNDYIEKDKKMAAADEGYKISLIVIKKTDDPGKDDERAHSVYEKIKAGESFESAAQKYSDDASAKAGGNLGFVSKSDLSKAFIDALSGLKPGEVSAPFVTDRGICIVRLESSRIYNSPSEFRQAVRDKLFAERFERDYKAWIKSLRQKAYVETR